MIAGTRLKKEGRDYAATWGHQCGPSSQACWRTPVNPSYSGGGGKRIKVLLKNKVKKQKDWIAGSDLASEKP
jgi:hypothetical protein